MSKHDIKIIGLDLDETTLNRDKIITPRVRAAIAAAGRAGILVMPATGRNLSGVPQQFLDIPGVRYAVTSNGAKIYEMPGRRVVHSDCFDTDTAVALVKASDATGAHTSAYIDGEGYCEEPDYEALSALMTPNSLAYMRSVRIVVPDLAAFVAQAVSPVEKLALMYTSAQQRSAAFDVLAARGDSVVTSSAASNWELNTPTADKGEGLLALGRLLGYGRRQIMAIGDGLNDVEMIRKVGYGVAMGNADAEVKAVADAVTLSCDEDGVAAAIEALLEG